MKKITLFFAFLLLLKTASTQPQIEWQRVLGGKGDEVAYDMIVTKDGGLLLVGYTTSSQDGDVTDTNKGNKDYWVVKMDNRPTSPQIEWQKSFGTSKEEVAYKVLEDVDNGHLIVIGKQGLAINQFHTDTLNNFDYWMLELDASGNLLRQKKFGSPYFDDYTSLPLDDFTQIELIRSKDKKHLFFLGEISSIEQQIFSHLDAWWIKMDWETWGVVAEEKYDFDGPGGFLYGSLVSGLVELPTGEFVFCANVSTGFDPKLQKRDEYWVQKIGANGKYISRKTFGGVQDDYPRDMIVDSDGNIVIVGQTISSDGDVPDNNGSNFTLDFWAIKLNSELKIIWTKNFGGTYNDAGWSIIQSSDGGYYISGNSGSTKSGDVCDFFRRGPFLIKIKKDGILEWSKSVGNDEGGIAYKVVERNQKPIVSGYTYTRRIDATTNLSYDSKDILIAQLGDLECEPLPKPILKKTVIGDSIKIEVVNTPVTDGKMLYRWSSPKRDTSIEQSWIEVPLSDSTLYEVRFNYFCCFSEPAFLSSELPPTSKDGGDWIITPNGDGQNDVFAPNWLSAGEAEVRIFNIWGQQIFCAKPYNNDWDGTRNGTPLSEGTYLYQINSEGKVYRGSVNVRYR